MVSAKSNLGRSKKQPRSKKNKIVLYSLTFKLGSVRVERSGKTTNLRVGDV